MKGTCLARNAVAAMLVLSAIVYADITGIYSGPGGSSGQLQYNSSDEHAGVSGSAVSGSTVTVAEIRASTAAFGSTAKSTFTYAGALNMASGTAITLSGSGGVVVSASSVTASAFFGNGAAMTGMSSTAAWQAADTVLEGYINSTGSALTTHAAANVVSFDGVGSATSSIRTDFLAADTLIGSATNTLRVDFLAADTLIGASTASLLTNINSTGSALTSHIAANALSFDAVGSSTASLRVDLTATGAATSTIRTDFLAADTLIGAATQAHNVSLTAHSNGLTELTVASATVTGNAFSVGGSTLACASGNCTFGGKVGIGTTVPATSLDVVGTSQFGTTAKSTFSTTGALTLATNGGLQLGTTFYVNGGRVGIGTTSPASLAHVDGVLTVGTQYVQDGRIEVRGYYGTATGRIAANGYNYFNVNSPYGVGIGDATPDGTLDVQSNVAPAGFALTVSSQNGTGMVNVTGAGNVGIGTTAPGGTLSVVGSSSFTSTANIAPTSAVMEVSSGTTGASFVRVNNNGKTGFGYINPAHQIHVLQNTQTEGVLQNIPVYITQNGQATNATDVTAAITAFSTENGTVEGTSGHRIAGLFRSSDTTSSRMPLFGSEGRVDAFGSASTYIGHLGYVLGTYSGNAGATQFRGIVARAQVTSDGTTANASGVPIALVIEDVVGGAPGYNFSLYQEGTDDINAIMGNTGIKSISPKSDLQMGAIADGSTSYFQLDGIDGAPAAGDCDGGTQVGRQVYDYTNNKLYICAVGGWRFLTTGT